MMSPIPTKIPWCLMETREGNSTSVALLPLPQEAPSPAVNLEIAFEILSMNSYDSIR